MSMEDAINRLARAIETGQNDVAVREIIRQRDDALKKLEASQNTAKTYNEWYVDTQDRYDKLVRRMNALRGVITRMKRERGKP